MATATKKEPNPKPQTRAMTRSAKQANGAKDTPKGVHAKLEAIVAEVGHVDKTGKIAFGKTKYDYMQEHGLLALLKPLWHKYGVTFVVGLADPAAVTQQGNLATVTVEAVLTDVETGETIEALYCGQGADQGDKATNKALTGANKYALQKFFQVPTEQIEDADATASEQLRAEPPSKGVPAEDADLVSAEDAEALREILKGANKEGYLSFARVTAQLQSAYNVSTIDELTPDQANSFAQWIADEIATARKAAKKQG